MLLEVGEINNIKGILFVYPVNEEDVPMFKHCTGYRYISLDDFEKESLPILKAHGLDKIEYRII